MLYIDPTATAIAEASVLYRNVLTEGVLDWSSETNDGFAANALGPQTYDFWTPESLPATLGVTLDASVECDACAIIAHTLGSAGAVVRLQYAGASRSNLCTYSESLDNAAWAKTRSTITANALRAPNGTNTADRLTENTAATATHAANGPSISFASGKSYVFSAFVKAGERNHIRLNLPSEAFTANRYAQADLTTGTVVLTSASATSGCEDYGNGWWRVWVQATATVTASGRPTVFLAAGPLFGDTSYTGDGTSGAYVWGVQVEEGVTPTSYIPTAASSVASTWHDAGRWIAPADDSDIFVLFGEKDSDQWRILITGTHEPHIGVVMIGPRLIIPFGVTPSYTPLNLALNVELLHSETVSGQFIDNRVVRTGAGTTIQLAPQEREWIETDAKPFIAHYNAGKPFIWASDPELLPDDFGYCWRSGGVLSASYGAGAIYGSMSMEVSAYYGG